MDKGNDRNPSMSSAPWLWWKSLAGLAVAVVIGAGATAAWFVGFGDRLEEPRCQPAAQDAQAGSCIASVRIRDIDISQRSNVSLTPDGGRPLVTGMAERKTLVLASLRVADGREEWRTSLGDLLGEARISVSPSGSKAAVWGADAATPVYILHVPGGAPLVDLPTGQPFSKYFDVAFSADEAAVVTGSSSERRVISLADPTAEPAIVPGFDRSDCTGPVGQSNIGSVRSRDNSMAALLLASYSPPIQIGHAGSSMGLQQDVCGAQWVAVLDAPADWRGKAIFASFSPRNNRLAVVYHEGRGFERPSPPEWRTLIEIWDTDAASFKRLAAFPIPGSVGYRIGWSQDGHRLAAVRSEDAGADALIYAVP
jgi:hypothetical protein